MDYGEFTDIAGQEYANVNEVLKRQYLKDRIKVRKKLRIFYLSLQGILKSAGCVAKIQGIEFDEAEQKKAEITWKWINGGLESMLGLIEHHQAQDLKQLKGEGR